MNFNPQNHLAATDRRVTLLERDGQPASAVTLSRTFAATADDLWDIVTNPDRLPRWFTNVTGDLQLNGQFQVQDNASGAIIACQPNSHFALTWEFGGDVGWVEADFASEAPDVTRLTLTHTAHVSPLGDTFGPGAAGVGWEMAFLGLALHIDNPAEPKPDEMEFVTSPEGIAFITGSSNGWAQAAIEAGTDPQTAQTAANQTTAFYTGVPI